MSRLILSYPDKGAGWKLSGQFRRVRALADALFGRNCCSVQQDFLPVRNVIKEDFIEVRITRSVFDWLDFDAW